MSTHGKSYGAEVQPLPVRRGWLADVEMSTVLVITTEDVTFKGLRRAVHDDCLVLCEAMVLGEEAATVLNGDVVIPREKVLAIQVVTA